MPRLTLFITPPLDSILAAPVFQSGIDKRPPYLRNRRYRRYPGLGITPDAGNPGSGEHGGFPAPMRERPDIPVELAA